MTGQELHNLIDKNLTQQGARDRITGLELREVEHALATEVGNLQNTSVIGLIYKDPV
jgi:rRNA maturation endonuclease Nob1